MVDSTHSNVLESNIYILLFFSLSFTDGLSFTTGQIGTLLLIASVTGIVFQATLLPFVRNKIPVNLLKLED